MRPFALALLVVLATGCATRIEAPVPPSTYEGDGPPPLPPHATDAGASKMARRAGGCSMDAAIAWPRAGTRFTLPVEPDFAREHGASWSQANVSMIVRGTETTQLPASPLADENLTFTLGTHDRSFLTGMTPGVYIPWTLTLKIDSPDEHLASLRPLGKDELHGWALVTRGSDDKMWFYLEGERLGEAPFPTARLLGGDLFLSGGGLCP